VSSAAQWRRCSACKQPIELGATYFVCSVSTCNRKRTGLAFCTVSCWEVHLPVANHREAWALEKTAPRTAEAPGQAAPVETASRPKRRIVASGSAAPRRDEAPREVLIVASRLKEYIRTRCGYNTSEGVLDPLSEIVRRVADRAIKSAQREGRRTVLDRDIPSDRDIP